jgi:sphingolipid delta-4 desaturase
MAGAFYVSAADQPHPARTLAILKAHPEIRQLIGRNPWTAMIMLGVVGLQVAIAFSMGRLGLDYWWAALLAAYGIGAFANHCLYVVVRLRTHRLIFRNRATNYLVAIIGDLPNLIPGAIGFSICHLAHHARQGDYRTDADLASDWEARLIGNRWYAKALWLLLFPLFQLTRPMRLKDISVITGWSLASLVASAAFDVAVLWFFGANALLYLGASMLFSIGLHPLGSRWIQEHFTLNPDQETGSYYGALNRLALNVGYHNEHHDFPSVPWNRLPAIRRMRARFTTRWCHPRPGSGFGSVSFDPRYSLYSRVLRAETE